MVDGEVIAPGFELFSPDSDFGQRMERAARSVWA